ncbi:hypothetical protein G9A89_006071 [Geosiphon pyriformis]|nr:hypothetical protein G9A89_006071 [Geosiphon pyriformis]
MRSLLIYYSHSDNPTRCGKSVPATELDLDIAKNTLPQFMFYTPNLDSDGHDTNITFAANYLSEFLPSKLLNSTFMSNNTLVIITFDESEHYDNTNQIYALLLGSPVEKYKGKIDNTTYDHYSLLHSVEANFGLG